MEDSTVPQTRLGSNWRGFSLLEPVILPLTQAESLSHTGTVLRLTTDENNNITIINRKIEKKMMLRK